LQLCQIFENRFINLDFFSPKKKTVICPFPPSLSSNSLLLQRSIDSGDVAPHTLTSRPIAHKSPTNSRSITNIGRRVLHDTCYIAHKFQRQRSRSQARIYRLYASSLPLLNSRNKMLYLSTCVIRGRQVGTYRVGRTRGSHTSCYFAKFSRHQSCQCYQDYIVVHDKVPLDVRSLL